MICLNVSIQAAISLFLVTSFGFYQVTQAEESCRLSDEALIYSAQQSCKEGKSNHCLLATALGAGAVSAKLRSQYPVDSPVRILNRIYLAAKKTEDISFDRWQADINAVSEAIDKGVIKPEEISKIKELHDRIKNDVNLSSEEKAKLIQKKEAIEGSLNAKIRRAAKSNREFDVLEALEKSEASVKLKTMPGRDMNPKIDFDLKAEIQKLPPELQQLGDSMWRTARTLRGLDRIESVRQHYQQLSQKLGQVFEGVDSKISEMYKLDSRGELPGSRFANGRTSNKYFDEMKVMKIAEAKFYRSTAKNFEVQSAKSGTGIFLFAGAAGIILDAAKTKIVLQKCYKKIGVDQTSAEKLAPFLEQVAAEEATRCHGIRVSMNKLEHALEHGEEIPSSVCQLMKNKNDDFENAPLNDVPEIKGTCEKSTIRSGESELGRLEKTADGYALNIQRAGGGHLNIQYTNRGGYDFDMPTMDCFSEDGRKDIACTSKSRNLFLDGATFTGNRSPWRRNLAESERFCSDKTGYAENEKKDLCQFSKSSQLLRMAMSAKFRDCEVVGMHGANSDQKNTDSQK